MRRSLATTGLATAIALAWAASASAGGWLFHGKNCECFRHDEKPHPTPDPGPKRHFCHTHERAGFPLCLAKHLEPTNNGDSYGYYVGGGGGHGSGPRCRNEGTYGWDYTGIHFPRRVALGWIHGRRYQGGTEAYHTNDPVPVPNVFTPEFRKALIHHEGEGGEGGEGGGGEAH